jgi:hypothetical protein
MNLNISLRGAALALLAFAFTGCETVETTPVTTTTTTETTEVRRVAPATTTETHVITTP